MRDRVGVLGSVERRVLLLRLTNAIVRLNLRHILNHEVLALNLVSGGHQVNVNIADLLYWRILTLLSLVGDFLIPIQC